jgi:hypothetical protein
MTDPLRDRWSDLRYTLDVILASAQARADLDELRAATADGAPRRFEFRLLAAAASEQPALPAGGWGDLRHQLRASVEADAGQLRLTLQAQGFAVLSELARAHARVRAANGEIDMRCRFDEAGRALLVLADTPGTREGLADFTVAILRMRD